MSERIVHQLFNEIHTLIESNTPQQQQADILYQLFAFIFLDITKRERLYFSTLFARIAFVGDRYGFGKRDLYYFHRFRRLYQRSRNAESKVSEELIHLGLYAVLKSIQHMYRVSIPDDLNTLIPNLNQLGEPEDYEVKSFYAHLRIIALGIEQNQNYLIGIPENMPSEKIKVMTNIPGRNEIFQENMEELISLEAFPISINLLQVEVDQDGFFRPGSFILEPDFLIDVTSVAECFKHYGTAASGYVIKKYLPRRHTVPLLTGNVANFFLDELITNDHISFREAFAKVFDLFPLEFGQMSDVEVKEFMQASRNHFNNLRHSLQNIFPSVNIKEENVILEPSFFSEKYGLQGRLDVFEHASNGQRMNIVELKSGKTFLPNAYKINHNHYIQTLLYDLIIQSVFPKASTTNYILYSKYHDDPLRYAPVIKSQQKEALFIRNKLLLYEKRLSQLPVREAHQFFLKFDRNNFPKASGFDAQNISTFQKAYTGLDGTEKLFWLYYSRFIATEHHLAKIGEEASDRVNGLASLWLNELSDKIERFEVFSRLKIQHIEFHQDEAPTIRLAKTRLTNKLANFRFGDIMVLYPHDDEKPGVLYHQIYKCVILEIQDRTISVQLRSKQINPELFKTFELWNLEKDILDSSFAALYRGLFGFAHATARKRKLLMGKIAPEQPVPDQPVLWSDDELTTEQKRILSKAIQAKDYFLLWGPPGTGKTSIMLRSMVRYLVDHTSQKIVLLAYTNRAVDEICEAVETIGPKMTDHYFRIGSRYSTDNRFKPQLLQTKMGDINTRKELIEFIRQQRIVVGTISSLQNKMELFNLAQFDTVIIDEASQILDPQLVGLLPMFQKFILIGDHKQLPAVVVQHEDQTKIDNQALNALGYYDMADSLFERLYQRCRKEEWHWAFDILSYQGRMHRDLMQFPSSHFYEDRLKVIPGKQELVEPLNLKIDQAWPTHFKLLATQRFIYIPTPVDNQSHNKTNTYEAEWVLKIVLALQQIYDLNETKLNSDAIGVITPYRAQIALLKDMFSDYAIDPNQFTIDTVERYQGGARDFVIFSLCTNFARQLQLMTSRSREGIDRKLNVAITRARKQLILIGNREILESDPNYKALISKAFVFNSSIKMTT